MLDKLRHLPRLGMGEAQRIYGLTARALRFYEERGLLVAHRDRMNHRYFDPAGRRRLGWISTLRRAGVSLTDVLEVLRAEEARGEGQQVALAKLAARRSQLAGQLDALDTVSQALASGADAMDIRPGGLLSAA